MPWAADLPADPAHCAIVVGYGPTGRAVTRLLRENGISPTVIELNVATVRQVREEGLSVVLGDAARAALAFIEDIMERLGATAEQIDRERARAHEELGGS